ncbi:MAG: hypothetical protein A2Z14_10370 [Chloroflexi bacterium RBG_16_48_8]|nr:MAG: hypothetical protein A2Z14_10370 [Chloroflexi bacterium RBG_16_48_8]
MKELIEFIAKSLVDNPSEVHVRVETRLDSVYLELSVADEDMGRVIGRGGRVANAMRALLHVAASQRGVRSSLDIV